MVATKVLTQGPKLVRKLYDFIDDKATNIPGRKTSSISVGKERQTRAKRKEKGLKATAGSSIAEYLIPDKLLEQQYAGSDSKGKTGATRRKDTIRDIKGTPSEIAADKESREMNKTSKKMSGGKVTYRKAGGKIGRGCGAAMRGAGKVMKA
tara:strand:+ start:995 stop:1447 length:453 start_codon:yes stop_codon:yes gene_type:complete